MENKTTICSKCKSVIQSDLQISRPTLDHIFITALLFFNLDEKELRKGRRKELVLFPRFKTALAMTEFGYTLNEIADKLGYTNHTSIIHCRNEMRKLMHGKIEHKKDYDFFYEAIKN